jgi:hypothetical protein
MALRSVQQLHLLLVRMVRKRFGQKSVRWNAIARLAPLVADQLVVSIFRKCCQRGGAQVFAHEAGLRGLKDSRRSVDRVTKYILVRSKPDAGSGGPASAEKGVARASPLY